MRAVIIALAMAAGPALAQGAGWSFSALQGEGDRAAVGCDREAVVEDFACLVVRCEDDFSTGVHVWTSRAGGDVGRWEMTADRENFTGEAVAADDAPYGARFVENDAEWLEERLRFGAFVYLRHVDDVDAEFRFIDLTGSLTAINTALAYCAPRVPEAVTPSLRSRP